MSLRRHPPRALSEAERALWELATRGVHPLRGRRRPKPAIEKSHAPPVAESVAPVGKAPLKTSAKSKIAAQTPRAAPTARPPVPPLAPLEQRTRKRLARGVIDIDRRIDLHGMTQHEAYAHLVRFLVTAQRDALQIVLVITGKGARGGERGHLGEERGVLRRVVPIWLRLPELRHVVVGFESAQPNHGGDGALYVRLRRPRSSQVMS